MKERIMNLVVDVGNTRIKYAFFKGKRLVEMKCGVEELVRDMMRYKERGEHIRLLLSGSGSISESMREGLTGLANESVEASSGMPLPLPVGYATPETLGIDRVAVCLGALQLFPGRPLLVVDSGTCVTFNYVNAEGVFVGGNISPGIGMRFRGLHDFTARLPLVEPDMPYGGVGRTTREAILNGVLDGMLFEIEGYVNRFRSAEKRGVVAVTGGGSAFLEGKLPEKVRFCPTLGVFGLNEILEFAKKS